MASNITLCAARTTNGSTEGRALPNDPDDYTNVTAYLGGTFHPNASGYAAEATLFADLLARA